MIEDCSDCKTVKIYSTLNPIHAGTIKSKLEVAGISSMTCGFNSPFPFLPGLGTIEILVDETDVPAAKKILAGKYAEVDKPDIPGKSIPPYKENRSQFMRRCLERT